MQPIHIEALFAGDGINPNESLQKHPREILHEADVIIGHDVMTENQFLVYGREALEAIANGGATASLAVLHISLDQESEELERLLALCRNVKGRDDYA